MRRSDRVAGVAAGVATTLLFGFVALPILAIFLRVPPAELVAQLRSPVVRDALWVSLRSTLIALALIVAFGTPAAYLLGSRPSAASGFSAVLSGHSGSRSRSPRLPS